MIILDPDAPGPIECRSFGTDEITIAWAPANGGIDEYVIEVDGRTLPTTDKTYTIDNLQSGTEYHVKVWTRCNNRTSNIKHEKTIYTSK